MLGGLGLLALAALVAGCGSSGSGPSASRPAPTATASATPTGSATPSPPGRCTAAQLAATVHFGPGAGTAGHMEAALLLRNHSSRACTVHGYPGVSFVDAAGRQIGASARRSGAGSIPTVTVRPGTSAGARLQIVDVGVYDPSQCRPTTASAVKVYPPDERHAIEAHRKLRACRGSQRVATIGPMQALSDLPPGLL